MKLILNLLVLVVLAYSGYIGYKRGIVTGALGIAAIIISIYVAFLVSNTYSGEFVGLVSPFVGGIVDSTITSTVEYDYTKTPEERAAEEAEGKSSGNMADKVIRKPVIDLTKDEKRDPYMVCLASMRRLGISEDASKKIAESVSAKSTTVGQKFIDVVSNELSAHICRLALFVIAFIIVYIVFTIIGNILCVNFGLPGMERANEIGGAVLGVVKGAVLLMFVACIFRYTGIFLTEDRLASAALFKFFIEHNLIAGKVGI